MTTTTRTVQAPAMEAVPVTFTDSGEGRPVLLLHGGGGTQTVAAFGVQLTAGGGVRVLTPTHPGFAGTPRPAGLASVGGLAALYGALLDDLGLDDVVVVGNSLGGWIGAELAILDSPRVTGAVLIDAVGLAVPGHPVVDFFSLPLEKIADYSYYAPDRFRIDPAALPPEARTAMAGNRAALAVYGGASMTDPGLAARLGAVRVPTLVLWGEADRIADPDYGRAFTAAIPGAAFHLLRGTGHLPQLETPEQTLRAVRAAVLGRTEVSIVTPGTGEITISGPVTMRILEDGSTTAHRLGLGEITLAPHTAGPPQHRHARHDEGFYVVTGTARFTVGDTDHDAPAGTLVMVPPGAPHTFANPGDEPAVLLNTFTPDLYIQYFRDLRDMISSGDAPGEDAVMARYATEPATDYAIAAVLPAWQR